MSFYPGRARLGATMLNVVWALLLLGCGAAGVGAHVWAQTSVDGAINGFVVDASGAALRDAIVRVQNTSTGLQSITASDSNGEFLIARLPAGEYEVLVQYALFDHLLLHHVVVELGTTTALEARMHVGQAATSITVTAEPDKPAAVTLEDASAIASTITPNEIERLPLDGRRWQAFALLTPEATSDPTSDGLISFRGVASTQNSTSIDGTDGDQSFSGVPVGSGSEIEPAEAAESNASSSIGRGTPDGGGGYGRHSGAAYTFSQEAVREFRVSGQNYSALYGHAAGGIVTTVSKSGTNTAHGTGFYLFRNSALAAINPFSIATNYSNGAITTGAVKPPDLRQQFGGSIGGPIMQDKLFYFYAYDQQRRSFPAISSPGYAAFYSLTPMQIALLDNRGVNPSQVNTALNYLDSLTGTIPRRADQTVNFAKVDWKASPVQRLSLQYDRARSTSPGGTQSAQVVDHGLASLGSSYARVDSLLSHWMWQATPFISNELRVQYGRDFQFETAQKPLPQEPAVGPSGYAPEIAIGPDGLIFGTPSSLGRKAYPDEHKVQLADLATWIHGHHQLQAGLDLSLVHDYVNALSNLEGTFQYDSGTTAGHAGGLVDWITDYTFNVNAYPNGGCPSIVSQPHYFCFRSYTQSFGQQAVTFNTQEWAGFVQDNWRARPNLTIDIGLRYEYELLPLPQQPNAILDAAFGVIGATSIFPEDRNNLGPRIGVSWQPFGTGRGVVRAGYGLFYGKLPGATVRSALLDTSLPTSTTHVQIVPTTVTECPQVANQGFGYACSYLTAPPAAVAATSSATVFDRRFRLPSVQQGSFTLEREVGAGIVGSATYLMNLDRQLPNSVDINIAPSTDTAFFQLQGGTGVPGVTDGETFSLPVYTKRLNTNFGPVTDVISNANATYNALAMEARRRTRGGLEFRASWIWSKAIDYGQSEGAIPRTNGQFDPFNVLYDKGLSSLNHPHKVVASAVWQPTLSTDHRWLRRAANGWLIAPLFTETSGRPYSFNIFGGTRLSGGHESINGSGGAVYLPTVGRNTLRLPDTSNLDLRISRTAHVTERVRMRGVAEVFNLTNRLNYSSITQRAFLAGTPVNGVTPLVFQNAAAIASEGLNVQPFGTYTAAATSQTQERQIQLGLRLEF